MYLNYFSLDRHPFRITPDISLFHSGGNKGRGVVLDAMLYAIENGEGILKVVGEVGSGKTMLCRMLEERLPQTTEIVYLANPNLTPEEILFAIAFDLKLAVRRDTTKLLVMQKLQSYLLEQHAANRKVVVIIEEAQSMPVETLEEIRLFSNLETHRDKLMQIIMFGQPELDKNLRAKNIRQLRERITHSFYLHPLRVEEVGDYIRFRLGAAGCPCPKLFTSRATWLVSRASGGLTRRINILADKALLAAYADTVIGYGSETLSKESRPPIGWKHVAAAIQDSDYKSYSLAAILSPLRFVATSVLIAAMALTFLLWPRGSGIAYQGLFNRGEIEPVQFVTSADDIQATDRTTAEFADEVELIENRDSKQITSTVEKFADKVLPVTNASPIAGSRTLVRERILASAEWLQNIDQDSYTVQLISGMSNNLKAAESFLLSLNREELIGQSYICMVSIGAGSYWAIKYGSFPTEDTAQNFVDTLPAHINKYAPFVQTMSDVECNSNNTIAALILE